MTWCKSIITFFSSFSQSDIITIAVCVVGIIFAIWRDSRKKNKERIDAFRKTLLPFKGILETASIPDHAAYNDGFITNLFSDQDKAMMIIRDRMNGKTKTELDKKWTEYKKERERYKYYWDTNLKGKFSLHKGSDKIINLIDEILKL